MKSIALSSSEIRAILDGRKTQMRQLVGLNQLQPSETPSYDWTFRGRAPVRSIAQQRRRGGAGWQDLTTDELIALCPYGQPGDRLWVRETWGMSYVDVVGDRPHVVGGHWGSPSRPGRKCAVVFRADVDSMPDDPGYEVARWSSAIHMPRWASRITLEIIDIRVHRLQDISEDDAIAEGVEPFFDRFACVGRKQHITSGELAEYAPFRASFSCTWDEVNGWRATWASNPWVWDIIFKRR